MAEKPDMTKLILRVAEPDGQGPQTESLWAEVIGPNRVKVSNIPWFSNAVAMGDVVETDAEGYFVRVVEPGGFWTVQGILEEGTSDDQKRALRAHLGEHGIGTEFARSWLFSISVPYKVSPETLQEIFAIGPAAVMGLHCGNDLLYR